MVPKGVAMIPYDLDPSLHAGEPERPSLDDGFAPPPADPADGEAAFAPGADPVTLLTSKSAF
jgi:hypothetical protein